MKLVLIGIPGAGKSTQGNLLSKQLNVPYLSTGHIFRNIAKDKTDIGRYVKETMSAGHLIPDERTVPIVEDYLSRKEYQKGYILDGFPRTLLQAKKFKNGVDKVIYLNLTDKEALWRIAYRNDEMRDDQTVTAMKKRIDIFHSVTRPVIDFYDKKGILATIDGTKSIKEVNKEILKNLGKQMIKNQLAAWEQKKKILIVMTGLPGSGKSEAAEFFKKKKIPIIHFGKAINDHVDRKGLEHTEQVHSQMRMEIRQKHGMQAMAVLNESNIKKAFKDSSIAVVDDLMSFEEYEYLTQTLRNIRVVILALWAPKELRYRRINKREYRGKLGGKDRDLNEIIAANKGPTFAYADYMLVNDESIEDLRSKLEFIYREVYFS
ncbi:hypothetical protein A2957_01660 [Candidatus Roizmanbacteria bacterium RIFCSPLOWO2_01_FULL_38_11]|uniref:Adenylate kinase n=2 Tax=Candidatus Roizmaniibacteriota TaxID=1752723 RepID=A0A1F7IKY2_9BACT|nr:MAG: hypothetical protein A2957_01660 [Candidatus Roizmanbacteria bacterium RIFCSPLOWO2_01_FULL_38_11]